MQYIEEVKCLKCFSSNPPSMTYCRYCHQRFSHVSTTAIDEDKQDKQINRKLIIAGTALAALIVGYAVFK